MDNPKVSILIPAYNSEEFIGETLQSCVDQTYPNVEIIVVDDGSTDRTLSIVKEWKQNYSRIKVYAQQNSGACVARNLAFEKSSGQYIMYLDADDIMSDDFVATQVATIESEADVDIAISGWSDFHDNVNDARKEIIPVYHDYEHGLDLLLDLWTTGSMLATSNYLVKRKLIENSDGWNVELLKNQDGEFFCRILLAADKIRYNPKGMFFYRRGDYDSVSKDNSKKKVESLLRSFVLYKESALQKEDSQRMRHALNVNFSLFMYLFNDKYPDLSRRAYTEIKSLGCKPLPSGTRRTKLISQIIGLRNFLTLRSALKRFR